MFKGQPFWILALALIGPFAFANGVPARLGALDLGTGKPASIQFEEAPRATVLVFLSARCPCSASHEAVLQSLYSRYSSQGVQFVAVHSNQDEPEAEARTHFAAAHLPFPVLEDTGAVIANHWGAVKTPHVYLVSPKGEILYQGGVDDSHIAAQAKKPYLTVALEQTLAGRRPEPAETRVLGCVIKR